MTIAKPSDIQNLDKTLVKTYTEFKNNAASDVMPLVFRQPVGTKSFVHAFYDSMPTERDWVGEKIPKGLELKKISGETEKKELTLQIDIEEAMSTVLSSYIQQFSRLGTNSGRYVDRLVADFLNNGTSSDAKYQNYDDKPLFATDHPTDAGGTQSNNLTSTALTHANLITAVETQEAFTDVLGNPLNLRSTHLIVPPQLKFAAIEAVNNSLVNGGDSNELQNYLDIITVPELADNGTTWYVASSTVAKPFTLYELAAPQLSSLTRPDNETVFWSDKLTYSWVARSAVRAGHWAGLVRCIA